MMNTEKKSGRRQNRRICVPFSQDDYGIVVTDASLFRAHINGMIAKYPELFPPGAKDGWRMKDSHVSKKLGITIRRVEIGGVSYTVRPSFVMPYMTDMTEDAEKGLFLRKFDVPFWAIARVLGKDAMHWQRTEQSLGRNSVVGTTVRNADDLPEHAAADEKHTVLRGEKAYVATTVACECVLGASVAGNADEESLEKAYGIYKDEARDVSPDYAPKTVNTDGWQATRNAWKNLFPSLTMILCFLHVFISIRDRTKKKFKEIYHDVVTKLWECYHAPTKASFSQRVRRLAEWTEKICAPDVILSKIRKLRDNLVCFSAAYDFPGAHRTSNMLDRLMRRMDCHLFNTQYFHGSMASAELGIRGWALILNFAPSSPGTVRKYKGLQSPAERLNGFRYHDCWLQNLMISASLGGFRRPPLNPL